MLIFPERLQQLQRLKKHRKRAQRAKRAGWPKMFRSFPIFFKCRQQKSKITEPFANVFRTVAATAEA